MKKMKGASTVKSVEVVNSLLPYVKMGFDKAEVLDIGSYALRHGWLNYTTYTQTVPENATDENGEVITTCRGGTFLRHLVLESGFPADGADAAAKHLRQNQHNACRGQTGFLTSCL